MAMCYQKHPFEIESEDKLTAINTKIFEIKKKIQLSEGQRKSCYEENEQEKRQNNDLIETLKKEIKVRYNELTQAKAVIGDEDEQIKKYLSTVCPVGNKNSEQIIHNLDLKVTEQRKRLDLLKYDSRKKKMRLKTLEREYEYLLIESTKGELVKSKSQAAARKAQGDINAIHQKINDGIDESKQREHINLDSLLISDLGPKSTERNSGNININTADNANEQTEKCYNVPDTSQVNVRNNVSHLENEIHKVLIQWTEAELVKKKYMTIRQALIDDSVKFESSLTHIEELLKKQREEIKKLEYVREEAAEMRIRATAATTAEAARAHDAEHARAQERAYFAQRFEERKRELEKLEKRIFPPAARVVIHTESNRSTEGDMNTEEMTAQQQMEEIFQRLMKLTGVTDAEEVFDRFRAQRETSKRLAYLQQTTEEEKLQLESTQTALIAELECFKFASVKDKDEGQDQINALKEEIKQEDELHTELNKKLDELENFLLDIKRLLYDLCKLLDVIPDPAMPEWTAEARDVQELLDVLSSRFEKARLKAEDVRVRRKDSAAIAVLPSNPTSGSPSVAGISMHSHSTAKEVEKTIPTYKELIQKEPVRPPPSDEEEDIPSRCYLKRQAQVIVDTKCRRKGFRPPFPRK